MNSIKFLNNFHKCSFKIKENMVNFGIAVVKFKSNIKKTKKFIEKYKINILTLYHIKKLLNNEHYLLKLEEKHITQLIDTSTYIPISIDHNKNFNHIYYSIGGDINRYIMDSNGEISRRTPENIIHNISQLKIIDMSLCVDKVYLNILLDTEKCILIYVEPYYFILTDDKKYYSKLKLKYA